MKFQVHGQFKKDSLEYRLWNRCAIKLVQGGNLHAFWITFRNSPACKEGLHARCTPWGYFLPCRLHSRSYRSYKILFWLSKCFRSPRPEWSDGYPREMKDLEIPYVSSVLSSSSQNIARVMQQKSQKYLFIGDYHSPLVILLRT